MLRIRGSRFTNSGTLYLIVVSTVVVFFLYLRYTVFSGDSISNKHSKTFREVDKAADKDFVSLADASKILEQKRSKNVAADSESAVATTNTKATASELKMESSDGIDDTVTSEVTCTTTAGELTIDVRSAWSPLGAKQFIELVDKGLFTDLPFLRVAPRYITQFGFRTGRKYTSQVIMDDPPMWGKRDMNFGYMFFAGSGKNSRKEEMVFALCDTAGCRQTGLGKAFWETPFGTVRSEGFSVLHAIESSGKPYPRLEMKGQHEKAGGPDRAMIMSDPEYLKREYPYMQYFKECHVVKRNVREIRPLTLDHPELGSAVGAAGAAGVGGGDSQVKSATGHSMENDKDGKFYVKMKVATQDGEGTVVLEIDPSWAPLGAARFKELVQSHFFDGARFFRVISKFMAQFGISGKPLTPQERPKPILDDPVKHSNSRGTISFAMSGKNTRSTQLFINFVDNKYLDREGFAPIGHVVLGMDIIDKLYAGYGEGGKGDGSDGKGPSQGKIQQMGNSYLDQYFPKLSFILSASLVRPVKSTPTAPTLYVDINEAS